ncbi:hypothetical protein M427DRAFT_264761, partial [Gonapodya prolifera JEL478]
SLELYGASTLESSAFLSWSSKLCLVASAFVGWRPPQTTHAWEMMGLLCTLDLKYGQAEVIQCLGNLETGEFLTLPVIQPRVLKSGTKTAPHCTTHAVPP